MDYIVLEDGTFKTTEIILDYAEEGYKILTFTASFSDGTIQRTEGVMHVKLSYNLPLPAGVEDVKGFESNYFFTEYDTSQPDYSPQPSKGKLDYRVYYHTINGIPESILKKPLVIIDGFDPGDQRKIEDFDSPKANDDHRSIAEMMSYPEPGNPDPVRLIPMLRALGYDVVIVNHPYYINNLGHLINGGADYIERNALTHASLYQALNDTLIQNNSTEELVIVGPSMGGQISRYALAYMEKNNIPHNTRLWVSVDSPHLGANIPIGIQSMVKLLADFGDSNEAADFFDNQIKSVAANQQLIEQYHVDNSPDYLNNGSPVRQQYNSNLFSNGLADSEGYPQNLRKIAIVNGSLNGGKVGSEGAEDFRVHGFLQHVWWDEKVVEMNSKYMGAKGATTQVARLWRLFKPTRTRTFTNINSNGSMDVVPGGVFNSEDVLTTSVLGEGIDQTNWWIGGLNWNDAGYGFSFWVFGDTVEMRTNLEIHSFIPTISSLAFYNSNFNWTQNLNRNLVCTGEIPFDTYFGPRNNEQHTSFTEKSVHWLLEELAGNPQPPTVHLDPEDMSGPTVICGTDTVTYSFDFCESLPVKAWEVSSNLIKTTPLTDYNRSIIVQPVHASTNGWAYVKAIFDSPNEPVQKNIWIGPPKVDFVEDVNITQINHTMPIVPPDSCDEFGLKLNISPSFNNVQEVEWEKVSTNYQWSQDPPGYNDPYVIIAPLCEDPVQFKVRMRNDCGWSDWQQIEDANTECQTNCGGGGGGSGTITSDHFIIYPVPADTVLHVNMIGTDPTDLLMAGDTLVIELFDGTGNQVKYLNAIACNNTIDVSTLNPGMYILQITYNNVPETHHIAIN